jgi:hypothetical protein
VPAEITGHRAVLSGAGERSPRRLRHSAGLLPARKQRDLLPNATAAVLLPGDGVPNADDLLPDADPDVLLPGDGLPDDDALLPDDDALLPDDDVLLPDDDVVLYDDVL